jgi:hypothetical protein
LSALLNCFKLVWAEQHALCTQFLPKQARKELKAPKLKSSYASICCQGFKFIQIGFGHTVSKVEILAEIVLKIEKMPKIPVNWIP